MGRKKTNSRETEFDEVAAYQQLLDFEEEWVRKPERNTLGRGAKNQNGNLRWHLP